MGPLPDWPMNCKFLCLLIDIAGQSQHNPISFICDTYRAKESSKQVVEEQQSLFRSPAIQDAHSAYDRIILNLAQFPKSNPHYFLMNQIQAKEKELKAKRFSYCFEYQKVIYSESV